MATPKLFRLKAEVAPAASGPRASVMPYVRVRVDTGVFHLEQLFDYQIPEKLSESANIGVRVQVPFGSRETEGIIVERFAVPEKAGDLKFITRVLSSIPVATEQSLQLIDTVARHYACNPWDVIRSAIPPRIASAEKDLPARQEFPHSPAKGAISFQSFKPYMYSHVQLSAMVQSLESNSSILIIAPDEKDVDLIAAELSNSDRPIFKITAAMPRADRYRHYLLAMNTANCIVIGTRSAIFTPVKNLSTIIIYKESSIDHYEVRTPGWNSKRVALFRAELESVNCVFLGFSPSLEMAQLIDQRMMKYVNTKETVNIKAFAPADGALLPGKIFSEIRKALEKGPVLFLAPRKGYGNALLCSHCRNIAMCDCGGRLSVLAKIAAPSCVHCGKIFQDWKCNFCNRDKQYLAGRGIDRAAEEIARAFPNFPVIISAGDVIKERVSAIPSLILATPGSQPLVDGGYSAIVLLDGLRFFAHTDVRTQERARELFLETASMVSKSGSVLLIIDDSHPICAAIARWNIAPLVKRELAERVELRLPPTVFSILLSMEQSSATQIAHGLRKAQSENRMPISTRIYGPTEIAKGSSKIVIHCEHADADSVTDLVHELQRRRSIAKKELLTLRVEPYSL